MKNSKYHIFFWSIYIVYVLILDILNAAAEDFRVAKELIVIMLEIWTFYSFYYTLRTFSKKGLRNILSGTLCFVVSLGIAFAIDNVRIAIGKYYHSIYYSSNTEFVIASLENYTQFAIYALLFFFVRRFFLRQKQVQLLERKELEAEKERLELKNNNIQLQQDKLQLEKELLLLENNFLRAQINPHFLYNSLNFFYSQTFEKQPEVAEGIVILSQIMRYSLNDFKNSNGLAWLSEEIEHIENVIKMYRMRFENDLNISFRVEGSPAGKEISPMVLITLVENVFKHGNLGDKDYPAVLACIIHEQEQKLVFITTNRKKRGDNGNNTGVGLNNIFQRLSILYKEKYNVEIGETATDYTIKLTMPYFEYRKLNPIYNLSPNYST